MVAGMDWSRGVGARLTALSLDEKGRLTSQLLPAAAVRCGILFDLALDGRLRLLEDGVDVDDRPTGSLQPTNCSRPCGPNRIAAWTPGSASADSA